VNIALFAVGRMKKGTEQDLATHYFSRFAKIAPSLGFKLVDIHEIAESRAHTPQTRREEEGRALLAALPAKARLIVLDEGGKQLSSRDFAEMLKSWRDGATKTALIALGGPDGHSAQTKARADCLLSLGRMTWPHQIARILIAEQLYRAATILNNHPYHRA